MKAAATTAPASEAACAARETLDLLRVEMALVPPAGGPVARLSLREPEARMARGGFGAAVRAFREHGGRARIVPAGFYRGAPRQDQPYGAAWELDAVAAAAEGTLACEAAADAEPPAWLEPDGGTFETTRAASGWLCHSFAGRREHERVEVAAAVPCTASRVLELGCSSGALGAALERAGLRVTGVEPDPEAARRAGSRLSRVIEGAIEESWDEIGSGWDAIVAADVLEHLEDPVAVLRELAARIAERGVLVAALPNASHASVLAGALQGRWDRTLEGVVAYGHRTYAGRAGWQRLLAAGGWRVERWEPLRLETPLAAPWRNALAAAGLAADEIAAYQWIVVASKVEAAGDLPLGVSDALGASVEDPAGFVSGRLAAGDAAVELPNALSPEALDVLLRGDVARGDARRALASGFAMAALADRLDAAGVRFAVTPRGPEPASALVQRALDEARRRGLPAGEPCAFSHFEVRR